METENIIKKSVLDDKVPFEINSSNPNTETAEAIREVQSMKVDSVLGKTYTDVDVMIKELLE